MKRLSIAAAIFASVLSTNASAEVVFRGSLVWTNAQNCESEQKGFEYTSNYHPRGAGNESFTGLSHTHQFGSAAYHLENADFTNAFKVVEGVATGWSWFTFEAEILVTRRVPATIRANTAFVTLKGKIKSPFEDPGVGGQPCIVTFEGAYRRDIRANPFRPSPGRRGR